VRTDRVKARQILINFLSAVKFTAAGEIRVRVEAVDGVARVHVADTGIGIAPEHLDRIFDPFWQVKQGLTRDAGGVGLGLTICQRLAELLDAEIAVHSTPGTGTTFTLALPLKP
jgi:signal transduction histidine kinase